MYKKVFGTMASKIDKGFVIILGKQVFKVNEIGARIFDLCNGKNDESTIIEILSKFYNTNKDEIKEDIQYFISELLNLKLIQLEIKR